MTIRSRTLPLLAAAGALGLLATACAATGPIRGAVSSTPSRTASTSAATSSPPVEDWPAVLEAADGQTVRWWLFGGDDRVNRYIDEHVVPAAAELGVTLERVPVADTADAVQRVVAEVRADEDDGSVDLVWVNGENFAAGKRADLWLSDWAGDLPNADLVDPDTVADDFGVAVDGQESP